MKVFEDCLLASDIDETLVIDGVVPERNFEKIAFFIENGGAFSLASGRLPSGAAGIAGQFKKLSPSVLGNGSLIYDFKGGKTIFEHTLSKNDYPVIRAVKDNFPHVGIECFYRDIVYVLNGGERISEHLEYESMTPQYISLSELDSLKLNKALFMCRDGEEAERIKSFAATVAKESRLCNTSFKIAGSPRYVVEQIPENISKASAVIKLAELLNIKKGCIYTIGDYYNDIEMIKAADIGAVTADAPDELKSAAAFVTGKAENGAVADFIDYLTFRKEAENEGRD